MPSYSFGKWLSTPPAGEEIIVSGLSGRLPESENVYEFQGNLFNKLNMVTDDHKRWEVDHPEIPKRIGKIYNIDKFDAGYFGVHYRQAQIMDPVIRIFLETAVEAVMDAGINPSELEGSRTGVFVGACYSDMECEILSKVIEPQKFAMTGYLRSFIPNRVSYHLKLKGPSVVVDTACSSSANALEIAFKAIRSGQCENAIVGGVNLLLHPGITLQFFRLGVLSSDGVCKVFDQKADGYARSESIVCIFLQKAKNARRIYSQIVFTKVNCDGFKPEGITFPSSQMQKELIIDVLNESEIAASDLSYLEAHGTGTQVGDPQELEAIDLSIAKQRQKPLLIGSVKCSIGHSEPGSGICSLFKVIIAMETGLIAPNINLNTLRETVKGFQEGRLKVVTELTELEGDEALVGINNFGFGGNNCHMVVRRFKKKKVEGGKPQDDIPRLVCVSGRTQESVLNLLDDLNKKPLDIEYVALLHQLYKRNHVNHCYRGYTIISNDGSAESYLQFFERESPLFVFFGKFNNNFFLLGKYLLKFPIFKSSLSRINGYLKSENINITDSFLNNEVKNDSILLAALAVQIAIVDILKLLKIKPAAVFGDHIGKLIAAYHYEIITLEETILKMINICSRPEEINIFLNLNTSKNKAIRSIFNNIQTFTNIENMNMDHLDSKNFNNLPRNGILLNISDNRFSKTDLLFVDGHNIKFLEVLGRLYQNGFNPDLEKLYPPVEYPVSRNTPMIAPMIKWDHKKRWHVYKFQNFGGFEVQQTTFNLTYLEEEYRYISGHVIDGRNLVPATEYLHLVWETFVKSRKFLVTDVPVVFENCKFLRAVTMPKSGYVGLVVSLQNGTGNFEIMENNSLVVSGRIYSPKDISLHKTNLSSITFDDSKRELVLEQDEIYRELYLRGYNYSGLFKGIARCNIDATAGLVKWEDNWTSFMDKMLQLKILQLETRMLYVPVAIKKLTIDPGKHISLIDKTTNMVPVSVYKENDVIKAGAIEIVGLQAKAIARRKPQLEPVIEKYEFVPNKTHLSLELAVTVNVQIILENSMESTFKAVEIVDEFCESSSQLLLPIVDKVLENVPVINPELQIFSKHVMEDIPHIKVEDCILTPTSNMILIVGTKLLERTNLNSILSAVSKNGYILTRENVDFTPEKIENIEIVTEYATETEKLFLFKKSESSEELQYIEISSKNYNWLSQLQNALKSKLQVVLYSQNQELSGIVGFVNCIRREPNGSKVKCFFMMESAPQFDPEIPFYQQQISKNLAINIYKHSQWGTYRHLLLENLEEIEGEQFCGTVTTVGDLSSMKWLKGPLTSQTPLKKNEILVYNYYTPLNFKDVMIASGRISTDAFTQNRVDQEYLLGFEFSGRDINGRRVMGLSKSGTLATIVAVDKELLWTVPDNYTLEQAATIPVVYSTVLYALLKTITLKRGMSVLIHSATGGVGLAAINVCLYYKCTIFVTVGTSEKRQYLRKHFPQIPETNIGNSHDTSFEQMVKTITKGHGVDIVINSLAEEKLMASIRCLARGGHLLEIGKFDLSNDTSLNLLLMEKEISYYGVMLDLVLALSPEGRQWLFNEISKGLRLGYIKPLPTTVFGFDEIEKAFRYMTTGKHMGKISIKIRDEREIVKSMTKQFTGHPKFNCDPRKCYIIVGGLGGFGLELADWLVLRGAKNLILVSSSGIKTGYQTQKIKIWKSYGVNIHISTHNVSTRNGCLDLMKESSKYGPVDGVFNLAAVLKDALFEDQTEENFHISLAPKADATQYLDEVTRKLFPDLRYFVVFSSVSCGRGNAGQTNYGMANSIMERICEKRKQDGLPALAIQWGAIGEVGLVAKMQKENKELVIGGTLQQKVSSCLQALDMFLNQQNPIVSSMVVAEKHSKIGSSSAVETISYILGIKDLKKINQNATFAELGMDSMVGTEIIQLLEKEFEIYVSAKEVRSLTFAKIAELEAEKSGIIGEPGTNKIEKTKNLILQFVPENNINKKPVINLPSKANENNNIPKVVVLCGVEGMFSTLESVTKRLNAHMIGLQYSYDDPQDTIEDTAKSMLPYVEEQLINDNKFRIVAYSYGAVVALELAVLLESKGYSGTIILIDGAPTYATAAALDHFPHNTEAEFETIVLIKLLSFVLPVDIVLQKKDDLLKCATFEERLEITKSMLPQEFRNTEQSALVLRKRFNALIKYRFNHDRVKSPVYLFKATHPMVSNIANDYDLSQCCEQVVVTDLDGDHVTILTQDKLVEELNILLSR